MTARRRAVARSAVEHAATLAPGSPMRWRDLELAAFARHRSVVVALDPHGRRARPGAVTIVRRIVVAVSALMPVLAVALLIGGRFAVEPLPEVRVPASAVMVALGLPVMAWLVWRLLAKGRQSAASLLGGVVVCAGVGALLLACTLGRAEPGAPDPLLPWLVPTFAWFALAAALAVGAGIAALRRTPQPRREARPLAAARAAVAGLTAEQREHVRADLAAALADLERRGVVDAASAAVARDAELGMLAVELSLTPRSGR